VYTPPVPTLRIIYASSSGHTEYVVGKLTDALKEKSPGLAVEVTRAEFAKPEDFSSGDALLLACGTWNTGGQEGQLNPHMFALLGDRAKAVDLGGKKVAVLGLGDSRYHFTAKAHDRLIDYVKTHNGNLVEPTLKIINEPYGQEGKIVEWASQLTSVFSA
jgi:flavodoxin I